MLEEGNLYDLDEGSVKTMATNRHCLRGSNDILEMPHAIPCCEPSEASECCMGLINQHAVAEYFLKLAIIWIREVRTVIWIK